MSWSKLFNNFQWQNKPSTSTPLGRTNLQKLNDAIDGIDDRLITNEVELTDTLQSGDVIANLRVGSTITPIKSAQVEVDDELSTVSENPVQNKVITAKINEKADKNGEITSAKASYSLLCDTPVNDNEPYAYRQFPVANAKLEKLKKLIGASVVWNQLVKNGNFATKSKWKAEGGSYNVANNIATFTATQTNALLAQSENYYKDHIYFATADIKLTTATPNIRLYLGGSGNSLIVNSQLTTEWQTLKGFFKPTADLSSSRFRIQDGRSANWDTVQIKNVMLIDLTAMFGSTIADYVNTLETAQAGSGIAWLKSYGFFTEEYYAYSVNTIQSVSVSGHKVVGKNIVDYSTATTNTDYYAPDGTKTSLASIKVLTTTQLSAGSYTITSIYNGSSSYPYTRVNAIDKNGDFISRLATNNTRTTTITLSSPCYLQLAVDVGITSLQLEFGSTASEYEPYTTETTALDHTEQRGIFYLDNGELKVDGDIYNADGSGSVKYEEVDMGDLNWQYGNNVFNVTISDKSLTYKMLSSAYITVEKTRGELQDGELGIYSSGDLRRIAIRDDRYTDSTIFKGHVTGEKLIYELATPTTASLTPFNPLSVIEQGGTEEFVDYGVEQGTRDVAIPVGTDTDFYQGLSLPTLPTSGGKVELTYDPTNGVFSWE